MSLKKQAEALLKVAEEIETQAAEVTSFVCDKCNHTTTLAKINASRKTAAEEMGENVRVSNIEVTDKVSCPACDGVLSYVESEESKPYYYETEVAAKAEDKKEGEEVEAKAAPHDEATETPQEEAAESVETQKAERAEGKHTASLDYDAIDRYIKG